MQIKADGHYIDGTFGRGGHSAVILAGLNENGRLLAFDKDPQALVAARERFADDPRFEICQDSFAHLQAQVQRRQWGSVDGILLDLGVSSPQLDDAARGFSFQKQGPLDMRMDPTQGMSAAEWIAQAPEQDIARVLKEYGEERFAKRIAGAIVKARTHRPIRTTRELAEIVAAANPAWEKNKDPATRSFQAIRIHINRELDDLRDCLAQVMQVLRPGGRLVVISFHSLEDRMVKQFMQRHSRGDDFPPDLPVRHDQLTPLLKIIGKAQRASAAELAANPRARSAVLRIAEKLA